MLHYIPPRTLRALAKPRSSGTGWARGKDYISEVNSDGFVKSRKIPFSVIPAPHQVRDKLQPESSIFKELQKTWTPFFNGVTTFYETINFTF